MLKELNTAALGMINNQTRLEVTANNIANVNTPSYKKESVFERNLIDAKASLFHIPQQIEQNDAPVGSYLDWSAGSYTNTGNPLDVALEGKGFFVAMNVDGEKTLTRSGSFKLNSEGYLTTQDGKFISGVDEDAIFIPDYATINETPNEKTGVDIVIAKTGEIYANNVAIGKLLIVDCDDYSQIERISKQDFVPLNEVKISQLDENMVNIKQQWLEGSNVSIIDEMVNMIELQRGFELGSKVIQTNDTTLERSIGTARYGYY